MVRARVLLIEDWSNRHDRFIYSRTKARVKPITITARVDDILRARFRLSYETGTVSVAELFR